jgi:hypothetical protein
MTVPVARCARLASILGALLALGCGGEDTTGPSSPPASGEHDAAAGATATSDAGGTSGQSGAGSGGVVSDASPAGSSSVGKSGAGSGGVAGATGGAGDVANAPGAGLDCAWAEDSPRCAAGLLATRPCSFGPRVSACVCFPPCQSADDCGGGASCVDVALASGEAGSICPFPYYTCAAP